MFLHVSVILFTDGGGGLAPGGSAPSMPCRFPGPHPRGKFRGIYLAGGGGLQAHTQGGSWVGSGPGPHLLMLATAAGSTHPTEMHSCFKTSTTYGSFTLQETDSDFRSHSCRWQLELEFESVQCENFCIVQCSHWFWSLNQSSNPVV